MTGEAPSLDDDLLYAWRCWQDLSSERPWIPGGLGPMLPSDTPWRAILQWADRRGMDDDDADTLVDYIKIIDSAFLAAQQRKQKLAT